jgi:hypothetical protein
MKTDEICDRYSENSVGLVLRLLNDDLGSPSDVLVEGSSDALKMLAELLMAVANEVENDSFSISPFGPGRFHFSKTAEIGIYIHRIVKPN